MNFTVTTIARSLAAHLAPVLPGVQMLEDPAQQGVEPPCMFLQQRYSNIKPHPGGRWLRTIGVDLTYLLDYNLPDLAAAVQFRRRNLRPLHGGVSLYRWYRHRPAAGL